MKAYKVTVLFLVTVILASAAVYAEGGFSAKVEVNTNLVQFYHQDIRNDTFIEEAQMPREDSVFWMRNPNYDDVDLTVKYSDPDGLYGAQIGFDFPGGELDKFFRMGDVFGWAKVSKFFRGKLGKYTDRVVEKTGGDKDLGVMLFGISGGDLVINTSDSLGLGSSAIGFLPTVILPGEAIGLDAFGQLYVSGFFAPNEYWLGRKITSGVDQNGTTSPTIVPAYATYRFGGSVKYILPGIFTLGFSYRTHHTQAGEGIDLGSIHKDMGIYAVIGLETLPSASLSVIEGLKIGLGYSNHLDYLDRENRDDLIKKPLKNAIHLDISYKDIIPGLDIGLFNNFSFYTLAKEDTLGYNKIIPDLFDDEKGTVVYNELYASYAITGNITTTLMVRNYYAMMYNYMGGKGQDYGKDIFIIEALVRYNLTDKVQVRSGFKFEMNRYNTPLLSEVQQNDNRAISIPVGIAVSW